MNSNSLLIGGLAAAFLSACSTGGEEERKVGEIKIDASHNMFGLGGNRRIPTFPIPRKTVGTDLGIFNMSLASQYSITRTAGTSSSQDYSLSAAGELNLVVPISGSASTRFVGAYREAKDDPANSANDRAGVYFFTDRFAPKASPIVGLFLGTDALDDKPSDPSGTWYLFSQHVMFSKSTIPREDQVGRSVEGMITIAAATGAIAGTGNESSGANIVFSGSAVAVSGRRINITKLDYRVASISDNRTFTCGQSKDIILGVDTQSTGLAAGLIALVRKFATPIASEAAGRKAIAGTYHFGMHTIFVRAGNSGIDAANGTIVFNEAGGWTLKGVGSAGNGPGNFDYDGTYTFSKDAAGKLTNRLVLAVKGPPAETWVAAVDATYGVVMIVDNDKEDRRPSTSSTELNFVVATRSVK
jgi:hypothetical protein